MVMSIGVPDGPAGLSKRSINLATKILKRPFKIAVDEHYCPK